MFLSVAWFHHQNATAVCVLSDMVLPNETQSINCLYKCWTVKNHHLTDLHRFTNLANILVGQHSLKSPTDDRQSGLVTWHEMLVENNILLNYSRCAVFAWDLGSIIPLFYSQGIVTQWKLTNTRRDWSGEFKYKGSGARSIIWWQHSRRGQKGFCGAMAFTINHRPSHTCLSAWVREQQSERNK